MLHGDVVVVDVATEIGGIVGIDGDREALVEHGLQGVVGHFVDAGKFDVGDRAHRENHTRIDQPLGEFSIVEHGIAVIDTINLEHVERFADIGCRPFLAGVGERLEPHLAGAVIDPFKLAGRVAQLGSVEPDADNPIVVGRRGLQHIFGGAGRQVAPETHNQFPRDAELARGILTGALDAVDHSTKGNAPGRVALRIEKHFGVADVVAVCPLKVGKR